MKGLNGWALVLTVLLLGLSSCTDVQSGTIVKKDYTPAWTQYVQTCTYYNQYGGCMAYFFNSIYWPATYELKVRDDHQDKPIDQRDTGWVDVSPSDFGTYQIGAQYP